MSRAIAAWPRYWIGPTQTIGTAGAIEPPSAHVLQFVVGQDRFSRADQLGRLVEAEIGEAFHHHRGRASARHEDQQHGGLGVLYALKVRREIGFLDWHAHVTQHRAAAGLECGGEGLLGVPARRVIADQRIGGFVMLGRPGAERDVGLLHGEGEAHGVMRFCGDGRRRRVGDDEGNLGLVGDRRHGDADRREGGARQQVDLIAGDQLLRQLPGAVEVGAAIVAVEQLDLDALRQVLLVQLDIEAKALVGVLAEARLRPAEGVDDTDLDGLRLGMSRQQCSEHERGKLQYNPDRALYIPPRFRNSAPRRRETAMTAHLDAEVLIAGGGPCGLMLANELGRRGIRTLLLTEKPSTSDFPQANATQARTMEHYRRLGFAAAVRSAGLPPDYPTDVTYWTRLATHELARFHLPSSGKAGDLVRTLSGSWSAAELPHRCSQIYVERVLRQEAEKHPGVSLAFGRRVRGFTDCGSHVEVTAEPAEGGPAKTFSAAYLVGADGPRSPIRKALGIAYAGESGAQRGYMGGPQHAIHFRSADLFSRIAGAKAWQYVTVNRDRRALVIPLDGKDEFVFHAQLRPDEESGEISESQARAMFTEALGAQCDLDIVARRSWTAGFTLVAESFRKGRVLLGGDAVHLFTPTGGLGYNTAVEDAVNLGWKLAAVLRSWGGEKILASYEAERLPVARRNTAYARGFADSIGLMPLPPELEAAGAAGDTARRAAGDYLAAHARAEFNIPGVTFGARYDGSPIVASDGMAPPRDEPNVYIPSAVPGGRAPHLWLGDGRSLYDALGFEFTLLRLGPRSPDSGAIVAAAHRIGMPLAVLALPNEEARDLYGADLALIRPDQIVAWRGNRLPDDPAALLAAVTGH
jgi:2-polyprenyl-6-methoxyphenol hydroxylase-like FAD-dependent oxidoreductase